MSDGLLRKGGEDRVHRHRKVSGVSGYADGGVTTRIGNTQAGQVCVCGGGEWKDEFSSGHLFITFSGITSGRCLARCLAGNKQK